MNLAVIGTGYVGLVTGACFAEYGNSVICVDSDERKIAALKENVIPIFEPNLAEMVSRNRALKTLEFTTDTKYAIESSDICFICVGTPQGEDGSTDLKYVKSVAADIGKYMSHEMIVVDKSTVPVGTADIVRSIIADGLATRGASIEFRMASNPEFLKEGDAIKDCTRPDRVIVGVDDDVTGDTLHELYKPFVKKNDNFIRMDVRSAEMTKYAANAMLATKISFMNEMANICERVGADVNKVRIGIGSDSRIGYSFIYPGIGYGGSCFPKDVNSLISTAELAGYEPSILTSVVKVNEYQKRSLCGKVVARFGEDLSGLRFAVWGLSFKPNTDDMREAPALYIIGELTERGAEISAYDPEAMEVAAESYFKGNGRIIYAKDRYSAIDGADALLLLTEWKTFLCPDFEMLKSRLKRPIIFDGRNQYDPSVLSELGFEHYQIGVGKGDAGAL
ncbi:MAG: UDP-glucose/GDP-mannose dehydrogenase family protein [Clostridiales Family XIII bacterium]|jgi:UDPglucose 6-dehydrogenase|nr:UDP-glucose/GDP-mannose dehydrogenase family protein [Clostridiales Family XIII bacterium]